MSEFNYENEDYIFRRLRRKANLTQAQICELTGLSQSTISRLEKEKEVSRADYNHTMPIVAYIFKKELDNG